MDATRSTRKETRKSPRQADLGGRGSIIGAYIRPDHLQIVTGHACPIQLNGELHSELATRTAENEMPIT